MGAAFFLTYFMNSLRNYLTIAAFLIGLIVSGIALGANALGFNLTPGFGIAQMAQLLVGLSFLTFAGYNHIHSRRRRNAPRSLQADIGIRLGLTGLVFCFVAGMSDLIGIGTHVQPRFERPFVGPLQIGGILLGILLIGAGLALYHTSRGSRLASSLKFLIEEETIEEQPVQAMEP